MNLFYFTRSHLSCYHLSIIWLSFFIPHNYNQLVIQLIWKGVSTWFPPLILPHTLTCSPRYIYKDANRMWRRLVLWDKSSKFLGSLIARSCGVQRQAPGEFSLPLKSVRSNKLLIREVQNITTIRVHRVIQKLKNKQWTKPPPSSTAPKRSTNCCIHSLENHASNFRHKTIYFSKGVGETEHHKYPRFLKLLLFSITF